MDRVCSMIGIALIFFLVISLCKDLKMNQRPHTSACSVASQQTASAKASGVVAEPEGGVVSDTQPLAFGVLNEQDKSWTKPKELTAAEQETSSHLDDVLSIENSEHFDKQMSGGSCNTSKHTYKKIVAAHSPVLPKPNRSEQNKARRNREAGQNQAKQKRPNA
jgi:hypothetical protein